MWDRHTDRDQYIIHVIPALEDKPGDDAAPAVVLDVLTPGDIPTVTSGDDERDEVF